MNEKATHDLEEPTSEPTHEVDEQDASGHSLAQMDFHRPIATSRSRELADSTRPGHPRKADKAQSKGRNGR